MSKQGSREKRSGTEWVTVMLVLERPPAEELADQGRGEKYASLKSSATEIRDQLLAWIEKQGLGEGIRRVGEPTAFSALFVTATREAAEELSQAPGVVDVQPAEAFRVDLLPEERDAPPEEGAPSPPGEEPAEDQAQG